MGRETSALSQQLRGFSDTSLGLRAHERQLNGAVRDLLSSHSRAESVSAAIETAVAIEAEKLASYLQRITPEVRELAAKIEAKAQQVARETTLKKIYGKGEILDGTLCAPPLLTSEISEATRTFFSEILEENPDLAADFIAGTKYCELSHTGRLKNKWNTTRKQGSVKTKASASQSYNLLAELAADYEKFLAFIIDPNNPLDRCWVPFSEDEELRLLARISEDYQNLVRANSCFSHDSKFAFLFSAISNWRHRREEAFDVEEGSSIRQQNRALKSLNSLSHLTAHLGHYEAILQLHKYRLDTQPPPTSRKSYASTIEDALVAVARRFNLAFIRSKHARPGSIAFWARTNQQANLPMQILENLLYYLLKNSIKASTTTQMKTDNIKVAVRIRKEAVIVIEIIDNCTGPLIEKALSDAKVCWKNNPFTAGHGLTDDEDLITLAEMPLLSARNKGIALSPRRITIGELSDCLLISTLSGKAVEGSFTSGLDLAEAIHACEVLGAEVIFEGLPNGEAKTTIFIGSPEEREKAVATMMGITG